MSNRAGQSCGHRDVFELEDNYDHIGVICFIWLGGECIAKMHFLINLDYRCCTHNIRGPLDSIFSQMSHSKQMNFLPETACSISLCKTTR